jgi:hypothetical protein
MSSDVEAVMERICKSSSSTTHAGGCPSATLVRCSGALSPLYSESFLPLYSESFLPLYSESFLPLYSEYFLPLYSENVRTSLLRESAPPKGRRHFATRAIAP